MAVRAAFAAEVRQAADQGAGLAAVAEGGRQAAGLAAFAAALVPGVSLHRPLEVRRPLTAQRTAPLLASETTRGQLLRAVHQVADLEAVASFYSGFGMCAAESSEERMLLTGSVGALDLEIVRRPGSGYVAGAGYAGLKGKMDGSEGEMHALSLTTKAPD